MKLKPSPTRWHSRQYPPAAKLPPNNHRRGDILIQNAGQELDAIDSDLAKRGRRDVLRRLCGVALVLVCAKSPTLALFHFRNLSRGLSRRTAALHGPWPRLIERSGATISPRLGDFPARRRVPDRRQHRQAAGAVRSPNEIVKP